MGYPVQELGDIARTYWLEGLKFNVEVFFYMLQNQPQCVECCEGHRCNLRKNSRISDMLGPLSVVGCTNADMAFSLRSQKAMASGKMEGNISLYQPPGGTFNGGARMPSPLQ